MNQSILTYDFEREVLTRYNHANQLIKLMKLATSIVTGDEDDFKRKFTQVDTSDKLARFQGLFGQLNLYIDEETEQNVLVLQFDYNKAYKEVEKHKEMLMKTKLPLNLDYKSKLDSQNSLAVKQIYKDWMKD